MTTEWTPEAIAQAYAYPLADRTDDEDAQRGWLRANMVTSLDGAAQIDGRVGDLTGSADQVLLTALRAMADCLIVGAGTIEAEGYGPLITPPQWRQYRADLGMAPDPRLVIVTRRGRVDVRRPELAAADPLVVHPSSCTADFGDAETLVCGESWVDLPRMVADLHERGWRRMLSEGGPTLLAELFTADLVDELDWAISPTVVGGPGLRLSHGPAITPLRWHQLAATTVGEHLFTRWTRDRG
ncbi:dihydrofolate reductase family protein [Parenemella sanctibonifatiensis]|nr:dihydrofolate reductase family protein [Parenemella sanctibonifatiensis]